MSEALTASLNAAQKEAVTMPPGPALILAGAGSGKTRVITHRIAWLIDEGHSRAREILAMTFTNRAAREMRERAETLCAMGSGRPTITTFHSACARWLRQYAAQADLTPNFSIYDADDTRGVVKRCAQNLSLPTDKGALRDYLQRIEQTHNEGWSIRELETQARGREDEEFADLFMAYQDALTQASAVDFGTLITRMLWLLEQNDGVRARFHHTYRHILVDEFQDTNTAQYRLLRALAPLDGSVMVVGDDDQSIYGWRGAKVENVQRFVEDYQDVRVIKLEDNYRSIAPILESAHTLVDRLSMRMPKRLRATRAGDAQPTLFVAYDDREESEYIANKIQSLREEHQLNYRAFAIFYRTNAQSRVLEQRLRQDGIPYQILGNVGYFERREVRDLLAWLRLIANPADDAAFERVRGTPPRGIGDVTFERLLAFREDYDSWLDAMEAWPHTKEAKRSRRSLKGIAELQTLLDELRVQRAHMRPDQLLETILTRSGYLEWLENTERDSFDDRARNIDELIHLARQISLEPPELDDEPERDALERFLEAVTLASQGEQSSDEDSVQLMTVHTAKGLEFPVVFLTGLEKGIFPLVHRQRELEEAFASEEGQEEQEYDEERRLAYVAITRAQDLLFLSAARRRQRFGQTLLSRPSLFLEELMSENQLVFDPESTTQTLDWRESSKSNTHAWAKRPAQEQAFDDGGGFDDLFDQRPWDERDDSISGDWIPDEGVIFDDRYYPEASVNAAQEWIGRRAHHRSFGIGEIVDADPTGDRVRLTIRFAEVGIKKVIADYIDIL